MTEQGPVNGAFLRRGSSWLRRQASLTMTAGRRTFLTLEPGVVGATGVASHESLLAVIAMTLIWVIKIAVRFLLQKHRDNVFADTVRKSDSKAELMRAISIYEAVRSRQLTPETIVRLLAPPKMVTEDDERAP